MTNFLLKIFYKVIYVSVFRQKQFSKTLLSQPIYLDIIDIHIPIANFHVAIIKIGIEYYRPIFRCIAHNEL